MFIQRLAQLLAIACIGIAAGIYLGDWAGPRTFRLQADLSSAVLYQQIIHVSYQRFMPFLVFGAVIGAAVWLFSIRSRARSAEFGVLAVALACSVAIAVMTRAISVPLNDALMTWDAAAPPADFHERWAPWDRVNAIRTVLATVALILELCAVLIFSRGSTPPSAS